VGVLKVGIEKLGIEKPGEEKPGELKLGALNVGEAKVGGANVGGDQLGGLKLTPLKLVLIPPPECWAAIWLFPLWNTGACRSAGGVQGVTVFRAGGLERCTTTIRLGPW
jgi:hypothetical protein